jgi:hypothetical protein
MGQRSMSGQLVASLQNLSRYCEATRHHDLNLYAQSMFSVFECLIVLHMHEVRFLIVFFYSLWTFKRITLLNNFIL